MMLTSSSKLLLDAPRSINAQIITITALVLGVWAVGCVGEMSPPPSAVECAPKTNRTCFCASSEMGVQACNEDGDLWEQCRCDCVPGELEEGACGEGQRGLRECDPSGTFWLACQCLEDGEELRLRIEDLQDDRCSTGEVYCPDVGCINLANSSENCGMCDRACEGCDRCFRGACTTICCADEANCGTTTSPICSDLDADRRNCGGCGFECAEGESCVQGHCVL